MQSKKKLLFFLLFISSTIYIFILTVTTTKYSPLAPHHKLTHQLAAFHEEDPLTLKELKLLSNIISQNQSRNLLFFGLNPQFLALAEAHIGGSAIILEDDAERILSYSFTTYRNVKVYMVRYKEVAGLAYDLLRHGREEEDCGLRARYNKDVGGPRCRLAMMGLPEEVYKKRWDVVVVDGPRGDRWDGPGRMNAIYTAAVIARMGRGADVFVHDVDRMIERWYSWEFLCHHNLVSAKGKLWHFRIDGRFLSQGFCPAKKVVIL